MNAQIFATALVEQHVARQDEVSRRHLSATTPTPHEDRRLVRQIYAGLPERERAALVATLRDAFVDGISMTLGILDGTDTIEGHRGRFSVQYTGDPSAPPLDPDLQELFLAAVDRFEARL